ncbi:TPA: terminase [Stenotrophomonas maltophilia]|nr:terminase [Stenotrophomonas maltophilia]
MPRKKPDAPKAKPAKKAAKAPSKGGRPTKYRAEYTRQASLLGRRGCTDPEVADFFGVALSTVNLWKIKHPEFSEALKLSKAEADLRVERALFERATGYRCREDDVRVVEGEIVVTSTDKQFPPDTTAAIFWLKNRRPGSWRDKPEGEDDSEAPAPVSVTVNVVSGRRRNANP